MSAELFRKCDPLNVGVNPALSAVADVEGDFAYLITTSNWETLCIALSVPEARALRDWLNQVLPEETP
jgi:hypothetical protein